MLNIPNYTCNDWKNGFKNASIDNNHEKYGYKIHYQKFCQYKDLSKCQDLFYNKKYKDILFCLNKKRIFKL